ncbi:hypothetical protein FZ929_19725 [Klebsiella pneumoniae]|uniref:Uncharacterized protein n=1 Tax=Klebsiella pneumoniae TaxID=573 RepID=A0A5C2LHR5_KLEPN|nr:hypothetical protein FZ929_19725 [Klebsiella pneumoniae]
MKIGINAKQKTNCVKFNLIAPLLARFIPELTRFSAAAAAIDGAIRRGAGCPSAGQPVVEKEA